MRERIVSRAAVRVKSPEKIHPHDFGHNEQPESDERIRKLRADEPESSPGLAAAVDQIERYENRAAVEAGEMHRMEPKRCRSNRVGQYQECAQAVRYNAYCKNGCNLSPDRLARQHR